MATKLAALQCRIITEYGCTYPKRYEEKTSFTSLVNYPFIILTESVLFLKNWYEIATNHLSKV